MSDLVNDSIYAWTWHDASGDYWRGFTVDDVGSYFAGQVLSWSAHPEYGFYTIDAVSPQGQDLSVAYQVLYGTGQYWQEGQTYVSDYYDVQTASHYTPINWPYPDGHFGPGSEYDSVLKYFGYDNFGGFGLWLA